MASLSHPPIYHQQTPMEAQSWLKLVGMKEELIYNKGGNIIAFCVIILCLLLNELVKNEIISNFILNRSGGIGRRHMIFKRNRKKY